MSGTEDNFSEIMLLSEFNQDIASSEGPHFCQPSKLYLFFFFYPNLLFKMCVYASIYVHWHFSVMQAGFSEMLELTTPVEAGRHNKCSS